MTSCRSGWFVVLLIAAWIIPAAASAQSSTELSPSMTIQSFDSRFKFAVRKLPSEYDYQTQQLMRARERHIQLLQQKEQALAAEQEQINAGYDYANRLFAAHKAAGDAVGMTEALGKISVFQKQATDLQNRSFAFAAYAQPSIDKYNNELIAIQADRAVRELMFGDASRASLIASQISGTQRIYQPRTDGGFVIIGPDGKYVLDANGQAKKFTTEDIAYAVYSLIGTPRGASERVTVRYRGEVPLDTFQCQQIDSSSFVKRVCYDVAQEYMVILLNGTYYHYCEIDRATVDGLLAAPSLGKYFNANIKGTGLDGPFDCRTHRVPEY